MAEERNVSRREFLKLAGLAGGTIAVAGGLGGLLAACGGTSTTTTTAAAATTTTAGGTATTTATTAAGATTTVAGGAQGTVKLKMLGTNQPGMEIVIADFAKEFPNIKIEPEFVNDLGAYDAGVPTQFAAGNGTDLIHLIGGVAGPISVGSFAKAGLIEDLSAAPWIPTMYAPTKPLMEYNGKVVAKDFGCCPLADLLYNKDLFTKNSWTIPTTYAELLTLCKKISDSGLVPISWGAGEVFVNINDFVVMAGDTVFANNPDWLQQRLDGKTTFAGTEGWHRAADQLTEMIAAKCFSPGAAGTSMTDMIAQFAQGQTAMMFTYGGMAGLVNSQTPDMTISQFAFPGDTAADSRIVVQSSGGMSEWIKSSVKDAANTFLEFWSRPEEAQKFCDAAAVLSPAQATSGELTGSYAEISDYFKSGKIIADPTAYWPNTSFNEKAGGSIQGLFTGQKTGDQVLADMDTYFDAKA